MPIYEYSCQKCGIVEVTQRITEKALAKCPTVQEQGQETDLQHVVSVEGHRLVRHRLCPQRAKRRVEKRERFEGVVVIRCKE